MRDERKGGRLRSEAKEVRNGNEGGGAGSDTYTKNVVLARHEVRPRYGGRESLFT